MTVGNEDVNGIAIVTGKGATATGVVITDGSSTGKLSLAGVQILPQPAAAFEPMFGPPGKVEADGTFRLRGLIGRRVFRVINLPPAWIVKSILHNGTDVTDQGMEFRSDEDVSDIRIVITDRTTEVTGSVTNQKGEPTRDYTVVIFPEDRTKWTYPTRYLRAGRADQDGLFKIRGLPPDERYLAAAIDYLEDGQGGDPAFLEQITDRATPFTLGEGETKAISLKLVIR